MEKHLAKLFNKIISNVNPAKNFIFSNLGFQGNGTL
jgi:hypothetical protein